MSLNRISDGGGGGVGKRGVGTGDRQTQDEILGKKLSQSRQI